MSNMENNIDEALDSNTPVLIGAGQCVHRPSVNRTIASTSELNLPPKSPIDMMADAVALAANDTGLGEKIYAYIDNITLTRFIVDAPTARPLPFGKYDNPPQTIAKRLGVKPSHLTYGPTGGNSPQLLVNLMAERIAKGEHQLVLLAGSECIHSLVRALKAGEKLDWRDDETRENMEDLGHKEPFGSSKSEIAHGLHHPINAYPMFENALRAHLGESFDQHQSQIGRLMAPFSQIAARHPQAWFPKAHEPSEIVQVGDNNRYVGFPYTKYMNAIMQVDQSAALIMTNIRTAQRLGVPREKWVFLHGCADVNDIWLMSERSNFHSSPAIRLMGKTALDMAGWAIDDVDFIDIYSCFPSAVQIGRDELGIAKDDPRALTVTGGLPYFGGCGNNYAMHAIATMIDRLRAQPGSKGLCTANGWYLTKHAIGLYSTTPTQNKEWQRIAPAKLQAEIDAIEHPREIAKAEGAAKIETYTVIHGRQGPKHGLIIGRLVETDRRFVAQVKNPSERDRLMCRDACGLPGQVHPDADGFNIWTPET